MINSNVDSSFKVARCPAAGSLTKALNRAVEISYLEFRIPGDRPSFEGSTCSALRGEWDTACQSMTKVIGRRGGRIRYRFTSMLKSCKRLFDVSCPPCDKKAGSVARSAWETHVGKDVPCAETERCKKMVPLLRERVRELTAGWGKRLREERLGIREPYLGEYVPDVQGCCETPSNEGGTLATGPGDYQFDWSLVRRGVAKTKGKHRVVTMQSAEVKRVLTPVHNALYDHISSFGWCVRGDVAKEDFEVVLGDLRDGETIISGDYQSATDFILHPAVEGIIEVLLECPELTDMEKGVLYGSFTDLRYKLRFGGQRPIKRGSMMGNLVSFPLLCLLNKACFDIACDLEAGQYNRRKIRINGDDCVFAGTPAFFERWVQCTSAFGLVVNQEKTGMSGRWMELNSSVYDAHKHSFVAKPVLSFLLPDRTKPGTILPAVISGISSFRKSVQHWIVKVVMRYEITLRGILPGLHCLGAKWRAELLKCRWFRAACLIDAPPLRCSGVNRDLPVRVGPPPYSEVFSFVEKQAAVLQSERVDLWLGVRVEPLSQSIDRPLARLRLKRLHSPRLASRFRFGGWRWEYLWPAELLEFVTLRFPSILRPSALEKWADDSPFLSRSPRIFESVASPPWRNPIFSSTFCSDYPLGHR